MTVGYDASVWGPPTHVGTSVEFLAPGFGLARPGHLQASGNELVNGRALIHSLPLK